MVHLYKIVTIGNKGVNLTKAKEALESISGISKVRLDTNSYEFEIFMDNHIETEDMNKTISQFGAKLEMTEDVKNFELKNFTPLFLIFLGILVFVSIKQVINGSFNFELSMTDFMAGFFITFAVFKLLDLRGFVDAYSTYDIVAGRYRVYGYFYPFIELLLGIAYLLQFQLFIVNIITIIVMTISSIGVIQSLLQKRKIRCACLGTKINLPMTTITAIEDLLRVGMAAVMIIS